jgi:hypothetical protein
LGRCPDRESCQDDKLLDLHTGGGSLSALTIHPILHTVRGTAPGRHSSWISAKVAGAFPPSRPAKDFLHRTGAQSPSQGDAGDGVSRRYPCLEPAVKELHRDEEVVLFVADATDKVNVRRMRSRSVSQVARMTQNPAHVLKAEDQPVRSPMRNVLNTFARDSDDPLPSEQASRENEIGGNDARGERLTVFLGHVAKVAEDGGR